MIFPDFSAELNKRRAEYVEVKKLLREKEGVRYGLVYPARLRVSFQGQEKMFDTPQAGITNIKRTRLQNIASHWKQHHNIRNETRGDAGFVEIAKK
ncbi:hypothetical protein AAFF_G00439370 [Aldrovandia affinis]|uniref:Uncharacterized protein n=1 Tax=Aldrovandia affinis TaxID=143900 RepID=A0AAD7S7L9_9TELE|nr:hypothetical protein AAFF_G00439370 [Aldrovandia affinis]